jgi:outer membrane protein OmpA-like peptidoglycan-associated protein
MKQFLIAFFFVLFCKYSFSQNIIKNPGFEDYYRLTIDEWFQQSNMGALVSVKFAIPNWLKIGWVNYNLIQCQADDPVTPWKIWSQKFGFKPYKGEGMIHMSTFGDLRGRGYVIQDLKQPLIKDSLYYFEMHVAMDAMTGYYAYSIGAEFMDFKPARYTWPKFPNPDFQFSEVIEQNKWYKVCGKYKATGKEKCLVIGNFIADKKINYEKNRKYKQIPATIYWIDEVSLVPLFEQNIIEIIHEENGNIDMLIEGRAHTGTFNSEYHINFALDDYNIQDSLFLSKLQQLAKILSKSERYIIFIDGHTDETGTDKYNKDLSLKRAITVKNYLKDYGANPSNIYCTGYGNTRPIEENSDSNINRRVELKVVVIETLP